MPQPSQNSTLTLQSWWKAVYPHAVALEKKITTSPTEFSVRDAEAIVADLKVIHANIQAAQYPDEAGIMRDHLLRATQNLQLAYEELQREISEEVEFYYSSALIQVAQLHHLLVLHGFAG